MDMNNCLPCGTILVATLCATSIALESSPPAGSGGWTITANAIEQIDRLRIRGHVQTAEITPICDKALTALKELDQQLAQEQNVS